MSKKKLTEKEFTKLVRKHYSGRLFWRSANAHWRIWNRGDVAMIRDGSLRIFITDYRLFAEEEGWLDDDNDSQ